MLFGLEQLYEFERLAHENNQKYGPVHSDKKSNLAMFLNRFLTALAV